VTEALLLLNGYMASVGTSSLEGDLWRRCTPPLEQSAGMRHLSEDTVHFQETFKNSAD